MSYWVHAGHGDFNHDVSGSGTDEAGRRCALGFNPGTHEATDKVKVMCAGAMKAIIDEREKARTAYQTMREGKGVNELEVEAYVDAMRCFDTALADIEKAQMAGVKGLHTRANAGITD